MPTSFTATPCRHRPWRNTISCKITTTHNIYRFPHIPLPPGQSKSSSPVFWPLITMFPPFKFTFTKCSPRPTPSINPKTNLSTADFLYRVGKRWKWRIRRPGASGRISRPNHERGNHSFLALLQCSGFSMDASIAPASWWGQSPSNDDIHALPWGQDDPKHCLPPPLIGVHTAKPHHLQHHEHPSCKYLDGGNRFGMVPLMHSREDWSIPGTAVVLCRHSLRRHTIIIKITTTPRIGIHIEANDSRGLIRHIAEISDWFRAVPAATFRRLPLEQRLIIASSTTFHWTDILRRAWMSFLTQCSHRRP